MKRPSYTRRLDHDWKTKSSQPHMRWDATLALLAVSVLYLSLPERLTPGPSWLMLVSVGILLIPTVGFHLAGRGQLNFGFGVATLTVITAAVIWSLAELIAALPDKRYPPADLLRSATALWASNVLVFASWYWRLDAGGPHKRERREEHTGGAFLFPQMTLQPGSKLFVKKWKPGFVDYLFLAFNTSTAFSPTDAPVLSPWAKVLMMIQSSISLGTVVILAARAINIL